MDVTLPKTKAVLLTIKAIFMGHMGYNPNKLAIFRRVVELDSDNLD